MKKTIIALIVVILLLLGFGVYSFVDNNRLKNENADLNAALLSQQEDISAATAEYDKAAAEAAELTAQLADLTARHETQSAELAAAQKELTDAGTQIADLTAQNETLQSESAALQADLDAAKTAAKTTGKEHAALQAELAEEQLLTATLEKEAADAQATLDAANKQATELAVEAADKQAALDKAAAEAILLNTQIAELTQQAADAAANFAEKQTALDEANALLAESQTALSNANQQVEALNTQLTEALAANKQMDSLTAQVADAQADAASKQAALDSANAQLDTANAQLDTANAQLDSANAQLDTANAQLDALNTQMDTLKTQVDELLQQVSDAQADAAQKQTALNAANAQVAELTAQTADLTAQVSNAQMLAANTQTALDAANAQVADLDAQLYAAQHVDYAALPEEELLALMSAIAPALEANNYNVAYAPVPVYQDEAYLAALPQALQARWALTVNNRESMTEKERMAFYAQLVEAELALLTPFDGAVYQDENLAKWAQCYLNALQSQHNAALSGKSATDDMFIQSWAEDGQYIREQALYNINKAYPITVDAAYESIFADMLAQGECVDVHLSIEEALTRQLAFAALPVEQAGKSVSLASFALANDTAHNAPLLTVEVDFMKKDKVVYTAPLFGGELPAGASAPTQAAVTDKQFDAIAFRYNLTVETATHRDTFSGVITPDTQYAFNGTLKQY